MQLGKLMLVLQPLTLHLLFVLCFSKFQLVTQLDDASAKLLDFVVCFGYCQLAVLALLVVGFLQFLPQGNDGFLEKLYFDELLFDLFIHAGTNDKDRAFCCAVPVCTLFG